MMPTTGCAFSIEIADQGAVDEVIVRPLGEALGHVRRAPSMPLDVGVDAPVPRGGVVRSGVPALHQLVARVQALATHDVRTLGRRTGCPRAGDRRRPSEEEHNQAALGRATAASAGSRQHSRDHTRVFHGVGDGRDGGAPARGAFRQQRSALQPPKETVMSPSRPSCASSPTTSRSAWAPIRWPCGWPLLPAWCGRARAVGMTPARRCIRSRWRTRTPIRSCSRTSARGERASRTSCASTWWWARRRRVSRGRRGGDGRRPAVRVRAQAGLSRS